VSSLAFLGSPPVSATCLRALKEAGHEITCVVTGKDKRRGRRGEPEPSAVKKAALDLGLQVSDRVEDAVSSGAELGVVVAFGRLIKPDVLQALPMVNLHFSLLPRWRGAAPVERAILAGDEVTGVCLMEVTEGLDEGGVYAREETRIGPAETARELTERLGEMGARLLVAKLAGGPAGLGAALPQQGEVTYAAKLSADELYLDFSEAAEILVRKVRLGRAWTTWRGGRLLVLRATSEAGPGGHRPGELVGEKVACEEGWLVPTEVRPEGRRAQSFSEFLRGARLAPRERLGAGGSGGGTLA
jgi:methionyl-tRNA formyltransferase